MSDRKVKLHSYKLNSAIRPIRDHATLMHVSAMVEEMMMADPIRMSAKWLNDRGWSAGPAVLNGPLGNWHSRLAGWASSHKCEECVGLMLPVEIAAKQFVDLCPDGTGFEACYRVPLTVAGLEAFDRERLGVSEFALVPLDQSWLVALNDELYVCAGTHDFVASVIGIGLGEVLKQFDRDSQHLRAAGEPAIQYLDSVRGYYHDFGRLNAV